MAKRSSFFIKQWGIKPVLFKHVEEALKQVPNLRSENGRINRVRLRNFMTTIDFIRPLIDWKNQDGYNELDILLDILLGKVNSLEQQLWVYKKKLELYLRIAREGIPDLLIEEEKKTFKFQDTETGEITDGFPEGFVNAET